MYGLIGEKLGHSFSKEIHEQLADYEYQLIPLNRAEFVRFMEEKPFTAINVTIPYKEAVIPYLAELDETAAAIGAVNTIINQNGRLIGYNTDYWGIFYLLRAHGLSFAGKKLMILGSGGTCKTITAVAKKQGAEEIIVVSRSGGDYQPGQGGIVSYEAAAEITDVEMIINASPRGMYPNNQEEPFDLANYPHLEAVLDVIYNPLRTALLVEAEARGIPAVGGLEMLVSQAKYAAEYFLGQSIPEERIQQIYQQILWRLTNLVLIAMPGAGKTTIGKLLAEELQRQFVDLDEAIVQQAGCSIPKIFAAGGEERFRKLEAEQVQQTAKQTGLVIATGGGVIKQPQNIKALRQNGVIFFLDRDLAKLQVGGGRPLSSNHAAVAELYRQRYPIYQAASQYQIDNNGQPQEAVEQIKAKLKEAFL